MRASLRRFTRWAFGLNAAYSGLQGLLALFAPGAAIEFFVGADADSAYMRALFRMLGALLVFVGYLSARVARDPDESPQLLRLMGGLSLLTFLCWGLALAAGDVTFGEVMYDLAASGLVLAAVGAYLPHVRRAGTPAEAEAPADPALGASDAPALPPADLLREFEAHELREVEERRQRELAEFDRKLAEALGKKHR